MFACLLFGAPVFAATALFEEQTLLTGGEGGYSQYFAPAAIRIYDDNVLLFCEGRKQSGDFSEIHMLLLRSADGGQNWSEPQVVWQDTSEPSVSIGNACPVYDAQTDTVWLGFTRNNLTVFTTNSTNGGLDWATPTEITSSVMPADWTRYWTGPGHGLQLANGPAAGRLVLPSYHIVDEGVGEGGRNVMRSHMVYSDDHGATWQVGGSTEIDPNVIDPNAIHMPPASWIPAGYDWEGAECSAVETFDGQLYLTIRNQPLYQGKKAYAVSNDGGLSWEPMGIADDLPGVRCQSSIIRLSDVNHGMVNRILYSGITSSSGGRNNMEVFLSEDEAASFPIQRTVTTGPASYSDMAVLDDHSVLLFYNGGASDPNETLRMAHFNLEWVKPSNPAPNIVNGDFEDTTGWGGVGSTSPPPGWATSAGRTNAAQMQSGAAAIGGEGTSAFMPAAPGENRDLIQEFSQSDSQWCFDMDFAAEEPDGQGSEHRTLSLGWITNEGKRIYMIVTVNGNEGTAADGLGDVQIYDPASGYFTPAGLEDAVIFDDDVEYSPLVQHLCIEGDFTDDQPYYDVYVTDSDGTVHSAMGLTFFNGGAPTAGSGLTIFADNTFLSTGDHLIDNVGIVNLSGPPFFPGDADGDGRVDADDAAVLAANWQATETATWAMGDFNGDRKVDNADATILAANWQRGVAASGAVPEPAAAVLLLPLVLRFLFVRRGRDKKSFYGDNIGFMERYSKIFC
jgi:sialidase-1